MPGPKTPQDALVWVKDAMAAGRCIPDPHFEKRCRQRRYSIFDAKGIIATATSCSTYPEAEILAGGPLGGFSGGTATAIRRHWVSRPSGITSGAAYCSSP